MRKPLLRVAAITLAVVACSFDRPAAQDESEDAIRDALSRLVRGRTVIAIAHRLSTVRNFDRIVVLQHGRIVEDGPPDQLMRARGPYRDLLRRQMIVKEAA